MSTKNNQNSWEGNFPVNKIIIQSVNFEFSRKVNKIQERVDDMMIIDLRGAKIELNMKMWAELQNLINETTGENILTNIRQVMKSSNFNELEDVLFEWEDIYGARISQQRWDISRRTPTIKIHNIWLNNVFYEEWNQEKHRLIPLQAEQESITELLNHVRHHAAFAVFQVLKGYYISKTFPYRRERDYEQETKEWLRKKEFFQWAGMEQKQENLPTFFMLMEELRDEKFERNRKILGPYYELMVSKFIELVNETMSGETDSEGGLIPLHIILEKTLSVNDEELKTALHWWIKPAN